MQGIKGGNNEWKTEIEGQDAILKCQGKKEDIYKIEKENVINDKYS